MNLRGPITLLNDAFTFYKTHCKSLAAIVLVPAILLAVGDFIMEIYSTEDGKMLDGTVPLVMLIVSATMLLVGAVWSILAYLSLSLYVANPSQYPKPTSAYKTARKYFGAYIWVAILSGLAVLGGLILLIIPGIIISTWLAFVPFTLLLEDKYGREALKASKALVKGRWWAVFLRQLAIGVIYLVVVLGFSFLIGLLIPYTSVVTILLNLASYFIFLPISVLWLYFLYKDLKATSPAVATSATPEAHAS